MRTFRFNLPQNTYNQIQYLQKKWSEEEIDYKYTIADIIRICIGTVWETENNSLNKTLTKSSKP